MISRRIHILLLSQFILVGLAAFAGGFFQSSGSPPDSKNKQNVGPKKHYWVCRRFNDSADADANGNLALAIHIYVENTQTKARIWQFDAVQGNQYNFKTNGRWDCDCEVKKLGDASSIKVEKLEFKLAGTQTIIGWATRTMGGKGHSKGMMGTHFKERPHARLVFRYHPNIIGANAKLQQEPKKELTEPCDDPPNDDVLEEEPITDPGQTPPPPLDYDP